MLKRSLSIPSGKGQGSGGALSLLIGHTQSGQLLSAFRINRDQRSVLLRQQTELFLQPSDLQCHPLVFRQLCYQPPSRVSTQAQSKYYPLVLLKKMIKTDLPKTKIV